MDDVINHNKINDSKVEPYKFIINSTNIPISMIKNKQLKQYLTQNPPTSVLSKKRTLFNSPNWQSF